MNVPVPDPGRLSPTAGGVAALGDPAVPRGLGFARRRALGSPLAHTLALMLCLLVQGASAEPLDADTELFQHGVAALERGAFEEAIAAFERLSDRGFVHPDASYNRAVAYARRARSPQFRPGDLGQAAAALAEAVELRPHDEVAELALEQVRAEIATRRIREGGEPVSATPSIPRAVVGLVAEITWLVLAALGSLVLTVGLALRELSRRHTVRLGGAVAAMVGATLLLICGGLAIAAGHYRRSSQPGIVVAREAQLLTETGHPMRSSGGAGPQDRVPEGERVVVLERQGALLRVEWGTLRAWVNAGQVRILARW